jgi:two-component system, LytTR family, sensor kinase
VRLPARIALVLVAWTLIGLFSAGQWYLFQLSRGEAPDWTGPLLPNLASCWIWAGFTPFIVRLAKRFRLQRATWPGTLALHLLFALAFSFLDASLDTLLGRWVATLRPPSSSILTEYFGQSFINVFSYFAVLAVAHAMQYHALFTERQVAASRLEAQLLGAQIRALEMQLRPHFLFNTLHTIASLVRAERNPVAVRMIAGLSDLLRASLRTDGPAEIPLRDELALVERYLAIERIRFQERLETRVSADPDALDALVPALILQPLVENAVRHGIECRAAPGRIDVEVQRRNGTLVLRVQDASSGAPGHARDGAGIGLSNTQARLRHLYGERQRFELSGTADGGAVALVELPFHDRPMHDGTAPHAGR